MRGGKRPGAGRKPEGPRGETALNTSIRLYPLQAKRLAALMKRRNETKTEVLRAAIDALWAART